MAHLHPKGLLLRHVDGDLGEVKINKNPKTAASCGLQLDHELELS